MCLLFASGEMFVILIYHGMKIIFCGDIVQFVQISLNIFSLHLQESFWRQTVLFKHTILIVYFTALSYYRIYLLV